MGSYRLCALPLLVAALAAAPAAAEAAGKADAGHDETSAPQQTKPDKATVELYGYLKLDGAWDDGPVDSGNFARWVASAASAQENSQFNLTARQSRLGMRIRRGDDELLVMGRVEIDFYGGGAENKNKPMLRHAYAEIDWPGKNVRLVAGQTSDLVSPLVPTTINYSVAWWAGNIGYRRPQLRVTRSGETWKLAAALSRTVGSDFDSADPGDSGSDSALPALQLAASRSWALGERTATVGFSGHFGSESLGERPGARGADVDSWSLNLDYVLPISEAFSLQGELWTGSNLDEFLGGVGQGIGLDSGHGVEAHGGWLALEGRPRPGTFVAFGLGIDDPDDARLAAGSRAKNTALWLTYLHDLRPYLRTGVELSSWATDYLDRDDGSALRLQGTLVYSF